MQNIYLLRHAQSTANAHKLVSGARDDSPLSELGQRQAELAGENAKAFHFDLIAVSPIGRALQTAVIIARKVNYPAGRILTLETLRERDMGSLDGKNYASIPQYDGNHESIEGNVPGLEPLAMLYRRANETLATLRLRPERQLLIVCHNGIGRMLRTAAANGQPIDMYKQPRLSNAVIYAL